MIVNTFTESTEEDLTPLEFETENELLEYLSEKAKDNVLKLYTQTSIQIGDIVYLTDMYFKLHEYIIFKDLTNLSRAAEVGYEINRISNLVANDSKWLTDKDVYNSIIRKIKVQMNFICSLHELHKKIIKILDEKEMV